MENCDNQAYVKTLKEKNAQQTIELASLRVEKVRTEGEQQKIMKRLTNELDGEKGQVKRLKDEIRRIQRQSQQLDSTYVASSRPPLQVCLIKSWGPIIYFFDGRSPSRHKERVSLFRRCLMVHFLEGIAPFKTLVQCKQWYINPNEKSN